MKILLSALLLMSVAVAGYADDTTDIPVDLAVSIEPTFDGESPKEPGLMTLSDEATEESASSNCVTNEISYHSTEAMAYILGTGQQTFVSQTCGSCSLNNCAGKARGAWCGNGKVCEIYLGLLCSDQQTWKCRCYSGIIP